MKMNDYAELCAYGNIEYTPAWYYQKFPGFFNVESYRILAGWTGGVRTEEQVKADEEKTLTNTPFPPTPEDMTEPEVSDMTETEVAEKTQEFYDSLDTLQYRWNSTLNSWQQQAKSTPETRMKAYTQAMENYTVEHSNEYTLSGDQQQYEVSEALNKKRKFESEDF